MKSLPVTQVSALFHALIIDPLLQASLKAAMSSPPILNPDVYLNYLLPSVASEYELNRNVNLATLGALIWDILSSIPSDCRLIRIGKAPVVSFAYFIARLDVLAGELTFFLSFLIGRHRWLWFF